MEGAPDDDSGVDGNWAVWDSQGHGISDEPTGAGMVRRSTRDGCRRRSFNDLELPTSRTRSVDRVGGECI
jgi:hypothetical protein